MPASSAVEPVIRLRAPSIVREHFACLQLTSGLDTNASALRMCCRIRLLGLGLIEEGTSTNRTHRDLERERMRVHQCLEDGRRSGLLRSD